MKEKVSGHYGPNWWENGIDENIRKRCEGRQRDELKNGREVELIDCLEFPTTSTSSREGRTGKKSCPKCRLKS